MSNAKVNADVKIIPAKRTASYDVAVESDRPKPRVVAARVNASDVTLSSNWPTASDRSSVKIPKTVAAVDAVLDLLVAVRAELGEQGVTE